MKNRRRNSLVDRAIKITKKYNIPESNDEGPKYKNIKK